VLLFALLSPLPTQRCKPLAWRSLNGTDTDPYLTVQLTDAFTIVILDGFGSPRSFYTLRAESVFEKTDWVRQLQ
jgi:hypothetical protein